MRALLAGGNADVVGRALALGAVIGGVAGSVACGSQGADAPHAAAPREIDVLAFASERREINDIELVRADGTGRVNLTRSRGVDEHEPSWSPDGKQLVIASRRAREPFPTLFVTDARGRGARIVLGRRRGWDTGPAWSPRGGWIAFDRGPSVEEPLLMVVRPDGTRLRRLTELNTDGASGASWAPDGKTLAFSAGTREGAGSFYLGQGEVFTIGLDGGRPRRLTRTLRLAELETAWSPDGRRIAVTAIDESRNEDIWVMEADGSNAVRLTENAGTPEGDGLDGLDGRDFGPAWSPDGTRIAFTSGRDGNFELYVMNADGSCETRLTRTRGLSEWDVAWRPRSPTARAAPLRC